MIGHRGWAVAAAIIGLLQEAELLDGIDLPAILGPVISDLSKEELEELDRQVFGPLSETWHVGSSPHVFGFVKPNGPCRVQAVIR